MLAHTPVLLNEMIKYLAPRAGENFLDCTFGAGGYSAAILNSCECRLTAIDRDPAVQEYADNCSREYKDRFKFINSSFASLREIFTDVKFDGIVADLGVSSMQLDMGVRGFSFTNDGPLDMRMSSKGEDAAVFINNASEADIADVIYQYGDEPFARKIARSIINERKIEPITNTVRLAKIVRSSVGFRKGKIDTATKTFQAIRIYVNDELKQLKILLEQSLKLLAPNGRLVIVSFHSLEDRIVKDFLRSNSAKIIARSKYAKPMIEAQDSELLRILTKKPISPLRDEILINPRSRSAKLRAAIRIGAGNDHTSI